MTTVIHSGTIINEGHRFIGYLAFDNGFITDIGQMPVPNHLLEISHCIDATGCFVIPGVIDTHVHFRDGGDAKSPKGNIASESRAAIAGGVTSFIDMPNTAPPTVSIDAWQKKMEHAASASAANYAFFLGATNSNLDTLVNADYSLIPGIKLFMGASTGNMLVDSDRMLNDLFCRCKDHIIAVHAEDQAIIDANKAALIAKFGTDDLPVALHPELRSRQACLSCADKAVKLAKKYGSRLHILHISTADELNLLDDGNIAHKQITAETCPHYLYFHDKYFKRLGAKIKCNPAIKGETDRNALVNALITGKIDTIATDHAPHLLADKEGNLFSAASGMPGIQFSLPLMMDLTLSHPHLTIERVVELMCHNPATIFGIDRRGFLRIGYHADIAIVKRESHTISDSDVLSLCAWTPYAGFKIQHKVINTFINGGNSPKPLNFNH